jgi:hypothetical protein
MAAWFTLFVPSDLTFLSLTACLVTRDETKKTSHTIHSRQYHEYHTRRARYGLNSNDNELEAVGGDEIHIAGGNDI